MHFIRPEWFFAFIPACFLCIWMWRGAQKISPWHKVCDPALLPHLLETGAMTFSRIPFYLLWGSLFVAIIGLAGPAWDAVSYPVYHQKNARVIVTDLSQSMLAKDLAPARYERAQFKILDILQQLPEGQTGLVLFAGKAFIASPLTEDSQTIAQMMPEINPHIMPVQGSHMLAGLKKAKMLFDRANMQRGSILLVTDSEVSSATKSFAESLRREGIQVHVYGVGTSKGGPIPQGTSFVKNDRGEVLMQSLPVRALSDLAKAGGGEYIAYRSDSQDENAILAAMNHATQGEYGKTHESLKQWRDEGVWFAWPLLLITVMRFRRGVL